MHQVRLEYAPTRPEPNRYRCRLTWRGGTTHEFFNRTYAGVYDLRDTGADYVAFVGELHGAVARCAPGCGFVAGSTGANYVLGVLSTLFLALMVFIAALFLVFNGLGWLILIKLVLLSIFFPNVVRWLKRNKPRAYRVGVIPSGVLPVTPVG